MGNCDGISKPKFTLEQIVNCQKCRYLSAKKKWCGRFGCWIVQPNRKIIRPFPRNNTEFNKDRFKRNYAVAVNMMAKNNSKPIISEDIFVKRRQECAICPPEDKQSCPCIGCKQWPKLVFAEVKCPKGKW
jgi:hypothetical protein